MEAELTLVVTRREPVAEDLLALELASADGKPLPRWMPGAHVDLVLPGAEREIVRQYSLCGNPADTSRWRLGVLRAPRGRGGSAYVHDELDVGEVVRSRGPRNRFRLEPAASYVFVAGGVGITPILPMVREVADSNARWRLVYVARSLRRMAWVDELTALGGNGHVVLHASGEQGRLDLNHLVAAAPRDAALYACGPDRMLQDLERAHAAGSRCSLHVERFVADATAPEASADTPFVVVVQSTGGSYRVEPGCSILDVLEEHGVDLECSCREGTCGTCETRVVEGLPVHRDVVLSPKEREAGELMMVCVSRSSTPRLVLDL
jgi:ferredoxin-NADP reductase